MIHTRNTKIVDILGFCALTLGYLWLGTFV